MFQAINKDVKGASTSVHVPGSEIKVGYEIKGVDISKPLSDSEFQENIFLPIVQNSVVAVRGQNLTVEQFIDFGRRFGKLEKHVISPNVLDGHPEVMHLSNIKKNNKNIGRPNPGAFWHTDLTFTNTPNDYSLLYSIEIPHDKNGMPRGDTCFRSTISAYETLPKTLKRKLTGISAKHFHLWIRRRYGDEEGIELSEVQRARMIDVLHPVICQQPETGRKYLFVNSAHTVGIQGMSEEESDALLNDVYEHIASQETYTHKWRVGDIVIWDNKATQHYATKDYEYPMRRHLWRLTVEGGAPHAAD
ncbi:TauD/TfdA dioxygenase family protein [Sneathiella sp.]|uniref:TauD/TfdA dioxygenase family protein n=1 Tax=Sneathiella sp. TaxID=1964365 RepID=UPI003565200E